MVHRLKIAPEYFAKVLDGTKSFEIRKHDRAFNVGDMLILSEYANGDFTDKNYICEIVYIITHEKFPDGIKEGYCVLGIKKEL